MKRGSIPNMTGIVNGVAEKLRKQNGKVARVRRLVGLVFMFAWLTVWFAESLQVIAHEHGLIDAAQHSLPLLAGLALFYPEALESIRKFRKGSE